MSAQSLTLHRRNLYILPTRHGWYFTLAMFVMLLAAINYNNGLAYAFTFLITAAGLMSMLYTHGNAVGLKLIASGAQPVFAGQAASFPIRVENQKGGERFNLWLLHKDGKERFNLSGNGFADLFINSSTDQRGSHVCPEITLSTDFPFGLLYTWSKRFNPEVSCLVYPVPVGEQPLPMSDSQQGSSYSDEKVDGDDFAGLREYHRGDSLKHVHWKVAARTDQLYTKLFSGAETGKIWLDYQQIPSQDIEEKLSQMSQWIIDADASGVRYGLRLTGTEFPPDNGPEHKHRCLAALALF